MTPDLKRKLQALAEAEGRTVGDYVNRFLEQYVETIDAAATAVPPKPTRKPKA